MGTGSFPEAKQTGRGDEHPPNPAPRLKKEYSYNLLPLWAFEACSEGKIYVLQALTKM